VPADVVGVQGDPLRRRQGAGVDPAGLRPQLGPALELAGQLAEPAGLDRRAGCDRGVDRRVQIPGRAAAAAARAPRPAAGDGLQGVGVEVAPDRYASGRKVDLHAFNVVAPAQRPLAGQEAHRQRFQLAGQAQHGQPELAVVDVQLDPRLSHHPVADRAGPAGLEAAYRMLLDDIHGRLPS
jgi:hypothetical protein